MELPIAPQTYQPSCDALVRAIKRVEVMLARMVAQETPLDGATVFSSAQRPGLHLANFAADVRLPPDRTAAQVLDEIDAAFAAANARCFRLIAMESAWPPTLAAEAESRGYALSPRHVLLLHSYKPPAKRNEDLQIIPGRAAYRQLRMFYERLAIDLHPCDERAARELAAAQIDHLDEPRVELFLGRLGGEAVGVAGLVTLGQIGVIDGVVTAPEARNRGVAGTLLAHAIDHCHRALFEQVILEVSPDTPAVRLYEGLGFKRVAEFAHYERV